MNKRAASFLCLAMITTPCFSQEQKLPEAPRLHRSHHHRSIVINMPDDEPSTPQNLKKLKMKLIAATAIITALITAGVSIIVAYKSCN